MMVPEESDSNSDVGYSECNLVYKFNETDGQLSCINQELISFPPVLIQEFATKTRQLDLSFNSIRTLDGLDKFTELEELVLDNNQIRHTVIVPHLPKLHTLMINKNCIDKLDVFVRAVEQSLPALSYLSLLGNSACPNQLSSIDNNDDDYQRYRIFLVYKLPNLRFIDASPVTNQERMDAANKGAFLSTVARPEIQLALNEDDKNPASPYHPLPSDGATDGRHPVGTYGSCKYIYYGRHSEGNRFIRNNDL